MPTSLSFIEAGVLPLVGLTAYQSLVHHAGLQKGQRVLINGCSGGVGLIGVQLAKALGAQVTGVCSAANTDQALKAGCDHVIDYRNNNPLEQENNFDVWFDVVGNQNLSKVRHQLNSDGIYLNIVKLLSTSLNGLLNPFRGQSSHAVFVHPSASDLEALRFVIEAGEIRPLIEQTYPLDGIAEAFERSRTQRVVGKLAIQTQ
jgi:NADPH:quinone reductase-like Zn-dependent oxidoreductase